MGTVLIPSTRPAMVIGGRLFTDLDNLKVLTSNFQGPTNRYGTFRDEGVSSGYQVGASTTLKIWAYRVYNFHSVANGINLLYSDADVGIATSTAHTNPVYLGGTSGSVSWIGSSNTIDASGVGIIEGALFFECASSKYPGGDIGGATHTGTARIYGYDD